MPLLLATPGSAQFPYPPRFSDVNGHWASACIEGAGNDQLMRGYPDGRFRPYGTMTRAEFAAVIVKAFPNAPAIRDAPNFSDVAPDFWGKNAIQTAYERGFLAGYPGNLFRPAQSITRVQAMVIIANTQARLGRAFSADSDEVVLNRFFEDAIAIPNYARSAIAQATRSSLVVNYPHARQLKPNNSITRGEATALLCRINEDGSDARHYIAAEYVAAFGYQFDAAGLPAAARPEPVLLTSFDSKLATSALLEGIALGEQLFFIDDETTTNLWRTDGTAEGTQLVRSLEFEREGDSDIGSSWARFLGVGDERFWILTQPSSSLFSTRKNLWSSDGTTEGTRETADFSPKLAEAIDQSEQTQTGWYQIEALGDRLPLLVQSRTDSQLWITDGYSDAGTEQLATFSSSTTYDNGFPNQYLTTTDDYLFFIATANVRGPYDLEWTDLWRTDGTPEGTLSIKKIGGLDPDLPIWPWQNRVYFMADTPEAGQELWTSDGTTAGTLLLKDIYPGSQGADPSVIGSTETALFILANSPKGVELWKTEGTPESTRLVRRLANENRFTDSYLYAIDDEKFFFGLSTSAPFMTATNSFELWVSDGTTAGTQLVEEQTGFRLGEAVSFKGRLFFNQRGAGGEELWVSDGTKAGTHQLVDLTPGLSPARVDCPLPRYVEGEGAEPEPCAYPGDEPSSTSPRMFRAQRDFLYFIATNNRLFRTDGTVRGMELVSLLDGYSDPSSNVNELGGKLLFMSDRANVTSPTENGPQLWAIAEAEMPTGFFQHTSPNAFSINYPADWYIKDNEPDYVSIWNQPPSRSPVFPPGFVKTDVWIQPIRFEDMVRDARAEERSPNSTSSLVRTEELTIDGKPAFRAFLENGENNEDTIVTLVRYSDTQTAQIVSFYASGETSKIETIQAVHQSFRVINP